MIKKNNKTFNALDRKYSLGEAEKKYHIQQWENPYESTIAFNKYLSAKLKKSQKIIDIGSGTGGSTYFISKNYLYIE